MGKLKAPHTFSELIFKAEGKYANWDPDVEIIDVGDFGVIDKDTGVFRRIGNIYNDPTILQAIPNIKEYLPVPGQWTEHQEVISKTAKSVAVRASSEVDTSVGPQAMFEGAWEFTRERGAVFVMRNATVSCIPQSIPDNILEEFIKSSSLQGMGLVTHVWKCSGYVRYLSTKGGDNVTIKLVADASIPPVPAISAGANVSARWEWRNGAGSLKQAYQTGSPVYTGMYTLRMPRRKRRIYFRGSGMAPEGEGTEKLGLYRPPWENDEEYEEEDEDFDVDTTKVSEGST